MVVGAKVNAPKLNSNALATIIFFIQFFICIAPFYSAAAPVSPVRIRTTCSTGVTKILPSPIFPVFADASIT